MRDITNMEDILMSLLSEYGYSDLEFDLFESYEGSDYYTFYGYCEEKVELIVVVYDNVVDIKERYFYEKNSVLFRQLPLNEVLRR